MPRELEPAAAMAKPGHFSMIGVGHKAAENTFNVLRGSLTYEPHFDVEDGGHGYKFRDPDLVTVVVSYTDRGVRIETDGIKYRFE